MKIYFAGSISGGRNDASLYSEIISHLKRYGVVLTEHIGNEDLKETGEFLPDKEIHDRDLEWLHQSDLIVAEITTPSLGVGYEIGRAIGKNKKILCLYRKLEGMRISGMIIGSQNTDCYEYKELEDAKRIIDEYFGKLL